MEELKKEIRNMGYIDMNDDIATDIAKVVIKYLKKLSLSDLLMLLNAE